MWALSLLACAAPEPETPLDPSPWAPDLPPLAEERLAPDDLDLDLEAILAQLLALHNRPVLDLYWAQLDLRDDTCPQTDWTDNGDGTVSDYWSDACTTAGGASFDGTVFGRTAEGLINGGYTWSGRDFKGWGSIVAPDGATLVVGGFITVYDGVAEDGDRWGYSHGRTDILWTGDGWEDAWFGSGLHPGLDLDAWWEDGAGRVVIGGQASGFAGEVVAIEVDGLAAMAPGFGSDCPEELGGTVSLRDEAGTWYDVRFDGGEAPEDPVEPAACDGCGAVTVDGAPHGSVCVDPAVLLDWEESPW